MINPPSLSAATVTTRSGVRIHGFRTGTLCLKSAHRKYSGLSALSLPAIILDTRWTEPLPILFWAIEHPEGVIVVDTGEIAAASDPQTYLSCSPDMAWFIGRNFRIAIPPNETVTEHLSAAGINAAQVRIVAQTHLHFDHAGGLAFFPGATFYAPAAEIAKPPAGAVPCLWNAGYRPVPVMHDKRTPLPAFPLGFPLTQTGDVWLVPTPGHTPGHQSVWVDGGDGKGGFLIAGDCAFSETRLWRNEVAGIVTDARQTRHTNEQVRALLRERPTVFLPSHDPESLARLASRQIAVPV